MTKKQPRTKGTGGIFKYKGSRYYWIAYVSGGKRRFESSGSERKSDAQALLTDRLGDTGKGLVVTPKIGRKSVGEGLKAVVDDLTMNGKESVDHTQRRIDKHILYHLATADEPEGGHFRSDRRMSTIATSDLTAYATHRLSQGAAAASVNQELAILRRAFRLAVRGGELLTMPHVPMLTLDNTRQGFLERHEFEAILKHLPAHLHAPLRFAFITGWRLRSEVLSMTVGQVDLVAGVVRLEPGETKNKEGRSFHFTLELRKVLETQMHSIEALKKRGTICPWVFHTADGTQVRDLRKAWKTACEGAGYVGKLFHDFRRSAVRTLERAGVPRSTAMKMVGHKTESIYKRYAIVDAAMLREGAEKLDAYRVEEKVAARGQVRKFRRRGL